MDDLSKIYYSEGIRGLYKGFVPGIFGVSHGAIQFMTYEEMKGTYNQYRMVHIDTKPGSVVYLTFATCSKFVTAALTYPYQVVRSCLQAQNHDYITVSSVSSSSSSSSPPPPPP
jgi:solute carrier family 25 folate transporter 32